MSKKILVTGGAGFIGANLSRQLTELSYEVIIYDNFINFLEKREGDYKFHQKQRLALLKDKAVIVKGDIRNFDLLLKTLKELRPEIIVHLAAIPIASISNKLANDALDININGLISIIRAVGAVDFVQRIVFTSSSFVYGNFLYSPADENHPTNPIDVYGGTKLAGENIIKGFATRFGVEYVIVRPSAVYGPTDSNHRVSQIFIENALSGRPLILNGPGQSLDFTYIKDAVQGFVLAITHDKAKNEIFNITCGAARTLREFAAILSARIPGITIVEREFEKHTPERGTLGISKARNYLGYNPQFTLEAGIDEYLTYLRSHDPTV